MKYRPFHLSPTPQTLPHLAQKYKALRLKALLQSPTSFAATYNQESQFTDAWWESRLQLPGRETFICAAKRSSPTEQGDINGNDGDEYGEWIAQVTLLGPIPASSYALPEAAQQPPIAPVDKEEKWQMLALYTAPEHQGKGVAKQLCREVFRWLRERRNGAEKGPERVRVRIMVRPDNLAVLKLYEGLGFVEAGRCTLAEALEANGDGEMVPVGGGEERFQTRVGLIMAVTLDTC